MDEPRRLLDDAQALSADERRVLETASARRVPAHAKRLVWGTLGVKLAAPATAAAASGIAASGGTTAVVVLLKSAGVGLALGAVAGTGLFIAGRVESNHPVAQQVAPTLRARATSEPTVRSGTPAVAAPTTSAFAAEAAPSVIAPHAVPRSPVEPRGDVAPRPSESQRVAEARSLLRAGQASRALQTLRALEADEPDGLLVQEREALLIEALAALGRRDSARERAAAFLTRYPTSPHAAAVRRATE